MYKHSSESIKESSRKMFVSEEEKNKFNNYDIIMRRKDDSYNKEETDERIKEISDISYSEVSGEYISEQNTFSGSITDIEIFGNTYQNPSNLSDIQSVGELQKDGTCILTLKSCSKNLFDKNNLYDNGVDIKNNPTSHRKGYDIKVLPNTIYTIRSDGSLHYRFLDKNKVFISSKNIDVLATTLTEITTPVNCRYLSVALLDKEDTTLNVNKDIFAVVQCNKNELNDSELVYNSSLTDINIPFQLKKIGDVSDRLFYDVEKKLWCIEKKIAEYDFVEDTEWFVGEELLNSKRYYTNLTNLKGLVDIKTVQDINTKGNILCKGFVNMKVSEVLNLDTECIGISKTQFSIRIKNDRLTTTDSIGVNNFILREKLVLFYELNTPQIIELPLDVQISLNSFYGITHIFTENTLVEPVIKCKLSKSLAASIDSVNSSLNALNIDLLNIEGLKESQNIRYETDKGYLICEHTRNSVIKDFSIEGDTIVNLANEPDKEWVFTLSAGDYYNDILVTNLSKLKTNTTYTLYYVTEILQNTTAGSLNYNIYANLGVGNGQMQYHPTNNMGTYMNIPKVGVETCSLINYSDFKNYTDLRLRPVMTPTRPIPDGEHIKYKIKNLILVEGDYTDKPLSYFGSMYSIGQDKGIELSTSSLSHNLLNPMKTEIRCKWRSDIEYIGGNRYRVKANPGLDDGVAYSELKPHFKLIPGETYYVYIKNVGPNSGYGVIWDNKTHATPIPGYSINTYFVATKEYTDIKIGLYCSITSYTDFDVMIYRSTDTTKNNPEVKEMSRNILYVNNENNIECVKELKKWDSIEKHSDGKYYYHKRSEKIVLNGSENWTPVASAAIVEGFTSLAIKLDNYDPKPNTVLCDKFRTDLTRVSTFEGIYSIDTYAGYNTIIVRLNNDKLSSQDAEGFNKWFQSNPVTIVYQLVEDYVYELVPLQLDTYDGGTLVLCDSGPISPKIEFSVTSHIGNILLSSANRIKQLEDQIYKYSESQNLLLLNSSYTSDRSSYDVELIRSMSIDQELDYDIFELTKSVIELESDNYDIDFMEELIDFYTIIGKFNYDMADVLFEMIDNQINPVIEIPEEEVSILPEI